MIARCILAALLCSLCACDWMPGRPVRADRPVPGDQVHDFNQLWTNYCSGCHGADGRFGPARPMNDPLYLSLASDAYLRRVITEGVEGTLMPPMVQSEGGILTDEQLDDIIKGMRSAWGQQDAVATSGPSLQGSPGSAKAGELVFAQRCAACHGSDGRGGEHAGSVVDDAFLAMTSDQALRSAIICGRLDLGMPNFRGRVGTRQVLTSGPLTSQQVSDLVAWLTSHRVQYPGSPYPDTKTIGEGN
ncbi:MAG: c-type cytochrome [Phycisphaerales bacterium]|nr:c-type cytochrome [Phycisphaerales bacterium]